VTINELLILIPAATAALVSIIHALQDRTRERKLDANTDLTAQTQATLETNTQLTAQTQATVQRVQRLVNGQSEALTLALQNAQARIAALEAELASLRATRLPAFDAPTTEA
jgi:heme oxygenase